MNIWKLVTVSTMFVASLTVAGCTKKHDCVPSGAVVQEVAPAPVPSVKCPLPSPSFVKPSFGPSVELRGDGIWEVGTDMPAGVWRSVEYPMAYKDCVWWVTPDPSKDPNTQSLPSFNDFKHGELYRITITLLPHQGFVTQKCGKWQLIDVR